MLFHPKHLTFTPFATCAAKLIALAILVRPRTCMCSIVCIAFSFCSSFTFNIGTSTLASSEKEMRLYIDDEMNQVKVERIFSYEYIVLLTKNDHYGVAL